MGLGGLVETRDQIYRGTKIFNIFNDTSAITPPETVAPSQVVDAAVVLAEMESICVPIVEDPQICSILNDISANTSAETVAPVLAEMEFISTSIQAPSKTKPTRKRPRHR